MFQVWKISQESVKYHLMKLTMMLIKRIKPPPSKTKQSKNKQTKKKQQKNPRRTGVQWLNANINRCCIGNNHLHTFHISIKSVQIEWVYHVDFCVWRNRLLLLSKGVIMSEWWQAITLPKRQSVVLLTNRWYPAKRALPAMLTRGKQGTFGRIPSKYDICIWYLITGLYPLYW